MATISLSAKDVDILLRNPGHGIGETQPDKVNIVFVGNESGIGNANDEREFITYLTNPKEYKSDSKSPLSTSPMLQFMNRLRIYYNEGKDSKWFNYQADLQPNDYKRIISEPWSEHNIHLIDLRPLPRSNESTWNYESIKRHDYLKAFSRYDTSFPNGIGDMVKARLNFLTSQINSFKNLEYIIAPGAPDMKKAFLKALFPTITFEEIIRGSRKVKGGYIPNKFWIADHNINGKNVRIIVSCFFNNQNGIGLSGLKELGMLMTSTAI